MIEASKLRGAGVKNVPAGHFFAPVEPKRSREMFLGGYAHGEPVLIALKEMAYAPAHQWDRPNGYVVSGVRIMVDSDSVKPATEDFEPGAIMLMDDRLAIVAEDTNGHDRQVIAIDRDQDLPRVSAAQDVAFTRWDAVVGEGDAQQTIYSYGSGGAGIHIF